ncbi:FecR family protein [Allocoleopsis franciscana]|uniref:Putative membrane protein n=1 Tax=Allocoleopsis franciscana PCC 7113 TaxID=1173027 RepID=K9WES5_9CYAN|nr:FecR family protein [Allocoleopsis franciscana]AFZ18264.1 putative membrane protein [Allocoleopsis franciscana PCC 7113]
MFRKIALLFAVTLWSSGSLLLPQEVLAQTALTRAVIESLKNQVRLIPKNQSARSARPSDAIIPGDALATAKASTAQLRFNDGSLARLGEQAVFRFSPGTRTMALSNGTALVLIPPGRGTTRVRTPNAAAGIRGSALFVRYIPETDTTIVGALTNSGIEVFNEGASQRQELKAGNMAVIVKDRIEKVYEFDLRTFYQTSDLASGLNLMKSESTPSVDEAIAQVQTETFDALQAQSPVTGQQIIENPSFVQLAVSPSQGFPSVDRLITDDTSSSPRNFDLPGNTSRNGIDVRTILEAGETRNSQVSPRNPNSPGSGGNFPGGGNTGGNFPGGGNTGGNFPGGGNTGGNFPGGGNTGGNFPGGGNTGGNFPGGGNTGGNFPGGGNTGGNFPGGGNTGGNFPGGGNTGGNFPGGGNTGGNFPGGGNTGGNFPGGGNVRSQVKNILNDLTIPPALTP